MVVTLTAVLPVLASRKRSRGPIAIALEQQGLCPCLGILKWIRVGPMATLADKEPLNIQCCG
eukprot:1778522-Prymnesium_polylepis.1